MSIEEAVHDYEHSTEYFLDQVQVVNDAQH